MLLEISRAIRYNGGLLKSQVAFNTDPTNQQDLEICVCINLEAPSLGGRELLFQVGPRSLWLAKAYAQAARGRGHASSFFQVFSSSLIRNSSISPNFPQLFFALKASQGSMQRQGEILLRLLEALDAAVGREEKDDESIFFDVLGSSVIVYGMNSTSFWLHTMIAEILVFIAMFIERPGIFNLLVMLASLLVAAAGGSFSMFMPFPNNPFVVAGLVVAPAVAAWSLFYWKFLLAFTPRSLFIHGRVFFGFLMTILTLSRSPASYLPMLWVVFPCAYSILDWLVPGSFAPAVALGYTIPVACTLQVAVSMLEIPNLGGEWLGAAVGLMVGVVLLGSVDLLRLSNFRKIGKLAFVFFLATLLFEIGFK